MQCPTLIKKKWFCLTTLMKRVTISILFSFSHVVIADDVVISPFITLNNTHSALCHRDTQTQMDAQTSGGTLANSPISGSAFYVTRYDEHFAGDLIRKDLFDGISDKTDCFTDETLNRLPSGVQLYGQICDKTDRWRAAEQLKHDTNRHIITAKRGDNGFTGQAFRFEHLSDEQKSRLKGKQFPDVFDHLGSDDDKLKQLIRYVKGDQTNESDDKFRVRENVLGAMTRSAPLVSGIPQISHAHPDKHSVSYRNFIKRYLYQKDNSTTPPTFKQLCSASCDKAVVDENNVDIVYVGANDGMLHAFRAFDGEEVFAYVPDAVYSNLSRLTHGKQTTAFVNGNMNVGVVGNQKDGWKKQLVGSMGGGAKGIFSLNISDPTADTATADEIVMWEFTDSDSDHVGNILGKPAIIQLNDGTWAVVIGNGYNAKSGKAALIIINAETGKLIQSIVLGNAVSGTANGLAPPYFQLFPEESGNQQNGIDRAYAGDLQGNLWVFDFTNASASGGVKVVNNKPLFTAINPDGVRQPISVAPLVRQHPTKYGNLIHFGTGTLFAAKDLSSGVQNSLYAIWDDWLPTDKGGLPTPRSTTVQRQHLNTVAFVSERSSNDNSKTKTTNDNEIIGRRLSKDNQPTQWATATVDSFTTKKRGWVIDLPLGERAWQSPYTTFGVNNVVAIGYDTVNYTSLAGTCSVSERGVHSWKMAFTIDDASRPLPAYGTLDTNGDGNITADDVVHQGSEGSPFSGLPFSGVNVSNAAISLFSPLAQTPDTKVSGDNLTGNDVCHFVTTIEKNNVGNLSAKSVCRRSYTGAWAELK